MSSHDPKGVLPDLHRGYRSAAPRSTGALPTAPNELPASLGNLHSRFRFRRPTFAIRCSLFAICTCLAPILTGCAAPRGASWTILASEMQGPHAVRNAERLAALLKQVKGFDARQVRVTHDNDGMSRIYYGAYVRKRNPQTGGLEIPADLARDLQTIKVLQLDEGGFPFALALKVPMPLPDTGHPAWSLTRVGQPYTLQVAVFEAGEVGNHKQEAADLCAQLRAAGYEAYYYHGVDSSIVTVGAFGPEAVRKVNGGYEYSAEVRALQQKENFRYNITNGKLLKVRRNGGEEPVASQLVIVPGHKVDEQGEWKIPRERP